MPSGDFQPKVPTRCDRARAFASATGIAGVSSGALPVAVEVHGETLTGMSPLTPLHASRTRREQRIEVGHVASGDRGFRLEVMAGFVAVENPHVSQRHGPREAGSRCKSRAFCTHSRRDSGSSTIRAAKSCAAEAFRATQERLRVFLSGPQHRDGTGGFKIGTHTKGTDERSRPTPGAECIDLLR